MNRLIALGQKIYRPWVGREFRRMIVFYCRVLLHKQQMNQLIDFFEQDNFKRELANINPFFFEQVTRQFFYKSSTFVERQKIVSEHVSYIVNNLNKTTIRSIYSIDGWKIWSEQFESKELSLVVFFHGGQRKEGLLSLVLKISDCEIYQMIFWIANDPENNQPVIWLGAMQGSNHPDALNIIKSLTKYFHGYRTKNLILYMLRCFAQSLGIEQIYAVSNEGFYANNHLRIDRKLKTSLDDFWLESGGSVCKDRRFYKLPVEEYRKSMDEIKTHKRNLYRKRFVKMDEVADVISIAVANKVI